MSSKVERQQRKAQLLGQIQLLNLRGWVIVGSSIMAVRTIRNPNLLVRWAKRGFSVWSIWRLVKSTIRQQQLRG